MVSMSITTEIREKKCNKCGVTKPITEYHRDREKPSGVSTICKVCRCKATRDYNKKKRKKAKEHVVGRRWGVKTNQVLYKVVYDPWDSFTCRSQFTRREIYDMLRENFLAPGTRFFRKRDKTYHEITADYKLEGVKS